MEEFSVSRAKAHFLALVDKVGKTGKPVRVTKHGKPIAEIIPASRNEARPDWIGSMRGEIQILGDIVGPIVDDDEWDDSK